MGKQTICIGENKGADQLRSNCEAVQRLCFRYSDSTIPLRNFKLLALFCACTGRFVSDLFGNHIVGFPTRRLKYERKRSKMSLVRTRRCRCRTQSVLRLRNRCLRLHITEICRMGRYTKNQTLINVGPGSIIIIASYDQSFLSRFCCL